MHDGHLFNVTRSQDECHILLDVHSFFTKCNTHVPLPAVLQSHTCAKLNQLPIALQSLPTVTAS